MTRTPLSAALLVVTCFIANVSAATVAVSDDASVNRANPDGNLNNLTTRGGLFSGLDDTGSDYEFFLKFVLPADVPAPQIASAKLIGTHTDDFDASVESFHQFYFVPSDAWSEATITFNNKPAVGDAINGAGFDASSLQPGDTVELDITDDVRREMEGDGVISLRLGTIDGRLGDMAFFASKEFDAARAFRLEISAAHVIPLPAAAHVGVLFFAGAAVLWRRL